MLCYKDVVLPNTPGKHSRCPPFPDSVCVASSWILFGADEDLSSLLLYK